MCSACFKENKQAVINIDDNISSNAKTKTKPTQMSTFLLLRSLNRNEKRNKYLKRKMNRQLCNCIVRWKQGWLGDWGNSAYNRLSLTKLIMQQTVRHHIKEPIVCCLLAVCNTNPMRGHHAAPVKKRYCRGKGTSENVWAEDFCFIGPVECFIHKDMTAASWWPLVSLAGLFI